MNINKYFLQLDKNIQNRIIEIVDGNWYQGWAKDNGVHSIVRLLFPEHIDFIWVESKYEAIASLLYDYAGRVLIYTKDGYSFGQYIRELNKKHNI